MIRDFLQSHYRTYRTPIGVCGSCGKRDFQPQLHRNCGSCGNENGGLPLEASQ